MPDDGQSLLDFLTYIEYRDPLYHNGFDRTISLDEGEEIKQEV